MKTTRQTPNTITIETAQGLSIYIDDSISSETNISIYDDQHEHLKSYIITKEYKFNTYTGPEEEEEQKNSCKNCKEPANKNLIGKFCSKFCRSDYYGE